MVIRANFCNGGDCDNGQSFFFSGILHVEYESDNTTSLVVIIYNIMYSCNNDCRLENKKKKQNTTIIIIIPFEEAAVTAAAVFNFHYIFPYVQKTVYKLHTIKTDTMLIFKS